MLQIADFKDFGQSLQGFSIEQMTEVYQTNEDGTGHKTLGYFKSPTIAEAFVGPKTNQNELRTTSALILTDGKIGYPLKFEDIKNVKFFDDEEEAVKLKKQALEKLDPAERTLLGLG